MLSMQTHDWLQKKRHAQDRKILLWAHLLTGGGAFAVYLYHLNLPATTYWMPTAGVSEILLATPVVLPYVVSAAYSWQVYSAPYVIHNRLRLASFVAVLMVGTLVLSFAIIAPAAWFKKSDLLLLFGNFVLVYVWAAELLLNVL
jgi:hypothetical protein